MGSVLGSNAMLGSESSLMRELRRGRWATLANPIVQRADAPHEQQVTLRITNPTDRRLLMDVEWDVPSGWTVKPRKIGMRVAAGHVSEQVLLVRAPKLTGRIGEFTLKGTAAFPFKSGITQPIHHTTRLQAKVRGVPAGLSAARAPNGVLVLNGKSAVRLPQAILREAGQVFTVECWARAGKPEANNQAVLSNNESSSFGLWWAYGGKKQPYVSLGIRGRGYVEARAKEADWTGWHHFAATSDGKKLRLFVDGALAAEKETNGEHTTNDLSLLVGADPDRSNRAGRHFTGWIDEVRVSKGIRYVEPFEPASVHERDDETVLLLHFDHDSIDVYFDDSGREHHGSPVGQPNIERAERR